MTAELEEERRARAALARTREPGDLWLARTVAEIGAVDLYGHLRPGRLRSGMAAEGAGRLARV